MCLGLFYPASNVCELSVEWLHEGRVYGMDGVKSMIFRGTSEEAADPDVGCTPAQPPKPCACRRFVSIDSIGNVRWTPLRTLESHLCRLEQQARALVNSKRHDSTVEAVDVEFGFALPRQPRPNAFTSNSGALVRTNRSNQPKISYESTVKEAVGGSKFVVRDSNDKRSGRPRLLLSQQATLYRRHHPVEAWRAEERPAVSS